MILRNHNNTIQFKIKIQKMHNKQYQKKPRFNSRCTASTTQIHVSIPLRCSWRLKLKNMMRWDMITARLKICEERKMKKKKKKERGIKKKSEKEGCVVACFLWFPRLVHHHHRLHTPFYPLNKKDYIFRKNKRDLNGGFALFLQLTSISISFWKNQEYIMSLCVILNIFFSIFLF